MAGAGVKPVSVPAVSGAEVGPEALEESVVVAEASVAGAAAGVPKKLNVGMAGALLAAAALLSPLRFAFTITLCLSFAGSASLHGPCCSISSSSSSTLFWFRSRSAARLDMLTVVKESRPVSREMTR